MVREHGNCDSDRFDFYRCSDLGVCRGKREEKKEKQAAIAYFEDVEAAKNDLLKSADEASLPVLDHRRFEYRPVAKENLLAVQVGVTRLEWKGTGTYRTRGASLSIPIAKGVRYRIGGGSISGEKSVQETAHGRLVVTDKALSFESPQKNERITWAQIADVELLCDGCTISKRSGPPRIYRVERPDPQFAATVEIMLARI
ncbi:MAG TPA: hypothetical protein VMM55_12295 [Thermohalobaculum sp.]|nr:hypothetical protein [Thermohalobaculum sp.]